MQRWTNFALRTAFIVGFLVVLPMIALPSVAAFLDQLLYGTAHSTIPAVPSSAGPLSDRATPPIANASPASLELSLPDESVPPADAERIQAVPPPPLGRAPNFLAPEHSNSQDPNSPKPAADVSPLDQATAQKIDAVRSRLEELGADYVALEMLEDGQTFHCFCDMLLENTGGQTQPFEATRNDPVAAAEAVLASVEAWRDAESSPAAAAKSRPKPPPR
jgi:hypothetical protein